MALVKSAWLSLIFLSEVLPNALLQISKKAYVILDAYILKIKGIISDVVFQSLHRIGLITHLP